tara:strand:- start:608 stop:883 length:276 start_codon:yes stop_codon:yes gene_type:complete
MWYINNVDKLVNELIMQITFEKSSAIVSPITVNDDNTMDITYVTNRDKAYRFDITEGDLVDTLTGAAANGESVGRFVALARKRGALAQQTA